MTLLLHTGAPTARIGIADEETVVARHEFPASRSLASLLAEEIQSLLQTTNSKPQALKRVIVHAGPGGFTGLRIGVTTANTLAYALGIPVVGVAGDVSDLDSLLAKSRNAKPAERNLAIPLYAKEPVIGVVPGIGTPSPRADSSLEKDSSTRIDT